MAPSASLRTASAERATRASDTRQPAAQIAGTKVGQSDFSAMGAAPAVTLQVETGKPATGHAGRRNSSNGRNAKPAIVEAQTACRVPADVRRKAIVAIHAAATSNAAFIERLHKMPIYLPSFLALSISADSRSKSSSFNWAAEISRRVATACSGEPSKNVRS